MATAMVMDTAMVRTRNRRKPSFTIADPGRLVVALLVCVLIAGLLAHQALSQHANQ